MTPARIIIEPHKVGWKMSIEDDYGNVLDWTLSGSRMMVWHMACLSWRRLSKKAR